MIPELNKLPVALYLDLEGTIITNWHDVILMTKEINWIRTTFKPTEVHLFSNAVWDDKDRQKFNDEIRPLLEDRLNAKFITTRTVEDFQRYYTTYTKKKFSYRHEFLHTVNKSESFAAMCKLMHKNSRCVLIDDLVANETTMVWDKNLVIETINIVKPYLAFKEY